VFPQSLAQGGWNDGFVLFLRNSFHTRRCDHDVVRGSQQASDFVEMRRLSRHSGHSRSQPEEIIDSHAVAKACA